MREGKQFIRADGGELVNVDHVVSMRIEGNRALLKLVDGREVWTPFELPLMALPPSIMPGRASDAIPVAKSGFR